MNYGLISNWVEPRVRSAYGGAREITTVRTLLAVFVALTVLGCSDPPGSPGPALAFTLSASPNSITGAPCGGCGAGSTDRESQTTITIRETGGAAGNVTAMAMTLRENGTNVVITQGEFDAAGITQMVGTTQLPASGTLNVPCMIHYPLAQQGKAATLTCTVRVRDSRGATVTNEIGVPVSAT